MEEWAHRGPRHGVVRKMRRLLATALLLLIGLCILAPAQAAVEIIIDNSGASFSGSWGTGTASSDKYGPDYRVAAISPSGGRNATYTPGIPSTASDWAVYAWYPQGSNRTTQAQYLIRHATGYDTVYLNQQINGGRWSYLGTYTMTAGDSCFVQITNLGTDTSKCVIADAIRFYSPTATPDTTPLAITEVTSTPNYDYATIGWFTDEGATTQVEYGLTAAYGTLTPKDMGYITSHSVQLSGLAPGTTYHYRVRSVDGSGNGAVSGDHTFTTSSALPTGSFRASWLTGWGRGYQTPEEVSSVIDTLYQANYNAFVFEARKCGDAAYNSAYEPKITSITPQTFDPLADFITKGHAKGIEVHAWIVTYRIADSTEANAPPVYWAHKDWLTKDNTGNPVGYGFYNLDQGVPGVQDYVCKIVKDIVNHYDVDGISLDYIRYYSDDWGYNEITKERFRQEYGFYPPISASELGWQLWCEYRRQQVSDFVKKCYLEIMALKPNVKLSVCTQVGGITNYETSGAYTQYFQDWRQWMRDHIVDMSLPMNYKDNADPVAAQSYRDVCDWSVANRYGRHNYMLQSTNLNTIPGSMAQLQYALDAGLEGVNTYAYFATNNESKPDSEFYSALKSTMFPTKVPVPDMPWKTAPATGIIFGNVTDSAKAPDPIYQSWIYKAVVTASGPVTRTTTTDATGTYGFIDLPPGTYTISIAKDGYPTRTYESRLLSAGQVLRQDCEFGNLFCPLASDAKVRPERSKVEMTAQVVSAAFPGYFYIEGEHHSGGIRVDKADHTFTPGMAVDISGLVKTNGDGERYIEAATVLPNGSGTREPIAISNRDLGGEARLDPVTGEGQSGVEGGSGVNNIGSLIWTTGKVTYLNARNGYVYLDDGSGLTDASGNTGIKVLLNGLGMPGPDTRVKVTGISSCFKDGAKLYRVIRATRIMPVN